MYPDVAASGMDPWRHYIEYGKSDGRAGGLHPSAEQFFREGYLEMYPDVAASGMDPWRHYVEYGKKEGRCDGHGLHSETKCKVMKNPYTVLGLNQNATNSEIVKSQIRALRSKKYTMKEITEAQAALRKPAQRLAADFTFPAFGSIELKPLVSGIKASGASIDALDPSKYDSLE